jgi:glycosyltransferase involved in cell wall biosynthesis
MNNYSGVRIGTWNNWNGKATVWYATRLQFYCGGFLYATRRLHPTTVYLNSMFSLSGAVLPILLKCVLRRTTLIVAPRGMLKPSALSTRRWKKWIWLRFLRISGLASRIRFHATSGEEASEVRAVFGSSARITVVPNIPRMPVTTIELHMKDAGELRLSLVGRVHPIKNVLFVIRLLSEVSFSCSLDIVGPAEDGAYYEECQKEVARLPSNVTVRFCGSLANEEVVRLVQRSHVMILPTLGENFGHAIFEALGLGIPVVISDQTYWRGLAADHAGWDLPLDQPAQFRSVLESLAAMDRDQYQAFQHGAHRRAIRFFEENDLKRAYLDMFLEDSKTCCQCFVKGPNQ